MASSVRSTQAAAQLPHLLIVEDEVDILTLIEHYFGSHGFRVSVAMDGSMMREVIERESINMVLLDLGLPREDGFELIRYLRSHWHGAIIIVTGRGDSVDRVVGLELGADDYVIKPFDMRELLARVRSVLRRFDASRSTEIDSPEDVSIEFAGFRLDLNARVLTSYSGSVIALTTGEFELLHVMLNNPSRVLSRDQLMEHMHGRMTGPFDRAIDVQIGRLRRKIEQDPSNPQLIKSIRGVGYVFAAHVQRR